MLGFTKQPERTPVSETKFLETLPPVIGRGRPNVWNGRLALLQTHPGQWFDVAQWGLTGRPNPSDMRLLGIELASRTLDGVVTHYVRVPKP